MGRFLDGSGELPKTQLPRAGSESIHSALPLLTSVYVAAKAIRVMEASVRAQESANRISLLQAELNAVHLEEVVRNSTNPATRKRAAAALKKLDEMEAILDLS